LYEETGALSSTCFGSTGRPRFETHRVSNQARPEEAALATTLRACAIAPSSRRPAEWQALAGMAKRSTDDSSLTRSAEPLYREIRAVLASARAPALRCQVEEQKLCEGAERP